ncbi:MAG TPA: helix-turn-helix transcriptional regulator [Candidatus Limnocylindria bacterium]
MDAARLLKTARARAGLSQRALGARAGMPQSMVAAIESGHQDPRHRTLDRLLRACGEELDLVPRAGHGVDRTQYRAALRRSPRERLEHAAAGAETLRRLRSARRVH